MKAQIKTFIRQGSGYAFSDGVYAEFRAEGFDRYEPVNDNDLEAELERLHAHFGPIEGTIRLERLVTEE